MCTVVGFVSPLSLKMDVDFNLNKLNVAYVTVTRKDFIFVIICIINE